MWRSAIVTCLVAVVGSGVLWWGTDGGQALTSETARRLDIAANPRLLPDVLLTDSDGRSLRLDDYHGAPLVLEFVYTTCPDICTVLGTAFEQLDEQAPVETRLLSISFDPADDVERLRWFAERHSATAPRWRVARIADEAAREELFRQAEVVVIPDGFGGYVHNAGLYIVDAEGRLVEVLEADDATGALAALANLAGS